MGNSKFNVSDASRLFFPNFLRAQNMVRVIEGKINIEMIWGETKSSLQEVRVIEGSSYRG